MLSEGHLLSLQDLAICQLPKAQEVREQATSTPDRHQAVRYFTQRSWMWTRTDPLATAEQRQAAHLLEMTYSHPKIATKIEIVYNKLADADLYEERKNKHDIDDLPLFEETLLSAAKLLCELSGMKQPKWVNEKLGGDVPEEQQQSVVTHRLQSRIHLLHAEIEAAQAVAFKADDHHCVWAKLLEMAEEKQGCLLGVVDDEIKYKHGDNVKFFKKSTLYDRMYRAKNR